MKRFQRVVCGRDTNCVSFITAFVFINVVSTHLFQKIPYSLTIGKAGFPMVIVILDADECTMALHLVFISLILAAHSFFTIQ